jgi:hypothetical protein
MTFLLALTLLLDPAPQTQGFSQGISQAPPEAVAVAPDSSTRTWVWVPAGGYGLSAAFAGIAATAVGFMGRHNTDDLNVGRANAAMAIGAAVGLVPGLILGQQARYEENDKARSAVLLLDAIGTLALGFGYAASHSRLAF